MFLTPLDVRELPGGKWMLLSDLIYQGNTDKIIVPSGFITDFASVPRVFWNIIPPFGRYTKAAVVHDFLYKERPLVWTTNDIMMSITRKDADGILDRIMGELETSSWRRWLIFKSVSWFGEDAWVWHRNSK